MNVDTPDNVSQIGDSESDDMPSLEDVEADDYEEVDDKDDYVEEDELLSLQEMEEISSSEPDDACHVFSAQPLPKTSSFNPLPISGHVAYCCTKCVRLHYLTLAYDLTISFSGMVCFKFGMLRPTLSMSTMVWLIIHYFAVSTGISSFSS